MAAILRAVHFGTARWIDAVHALRSSGCRCCWLPAAEDAAGELALRADVQQADFIRVREPGHDVLLRGGVETVRAVGSWLEARYAG